MITEDADYKFSEGDVVDFHSIIGGPITSGPHTIESVGQMCGTEIAFITNHRGCVAQDALSMHEKKER